MADNDDGRNGAGTLVVGMANPETADDLMNLAACIAEYAGYEIICAHVVTVPPQASLASGRNSAEVAKGRKLVAAGVRIGANMGVNARGIVKVARSVDEGLIAAGEAQQADILLVGHSTAGTDADASEKSFDKIMHHVASGTTSDLIVAKFRKQSMDSLLIPILTEVNLRLVNLLARSILAHTDADVTFLHVVEQQSEKTQAEDEMNELLQNYDLYELGPLRIIAADDPLAAAVHEADAHDAVIVGALAQPSITDSIFGSWAEHLSSRTDSTVLVVRAEREQQ